MVTNIGNTNLKNIISDHETPGSGTYAWYLLKASLAEPRAPLINADFAAEVNIKDKFFDLTTIWKLTWIINGGTEATNFKKMLETWEAGNTRLYLSVKNEWGVELAVRGTQAVPATLNQLRGKCFSLRTLDVEPNSWEGSIEFHFTTQ
jgi:hypothetical protein